MKRQIINNKRELVFYYLTSANTSVIVHLGNYIRPQSTKVFKQLRDMMSKSNDSIIGFGYRSRYEDEIINEETFGVLN